MGGLTTLVDTSVLIGALDTLDAGKQGSCAISVITIGELHAGVLLARHGPTRAARLKHLTAILHVLSVLEIDRRVAAAYGELRTQSGRAPSNDLWIAATALAHNLELMTMDEGQATLPLVRATLIATAR